MIFIRKTRQCLFGVKEITLLARGIQVRFAQCLEHLEALLCREDLCTERRNLPFQHLVEHNNVSRSLRHANAVIRMEQAVLALVVSDTVRHSG